jgi:hypothetical protein
MGDMDLGWLIVGAICTVGTIQLILWIIVMIKHPGCDDLVLVQGASSQVTGSHLHQRS